MSKTSRRTAPYLTDRQSRLDILRAEGAILALSHEITKVACLGTTPEPVGDEMTQIAQDLGILRARLIKVLG